MARQLQRQNGKKKRTGRRILIGLGAFVLVLFVLAALLPTFVSWGLGRGLITGAIEDQINGNVTIKEISVGWFSAQRIEGLAITSADQETVITAGATLDRGLLPILFGTDDFGALTIRGDVAGVRYGDGTTSFATLLKPSEEKDDETTLPDVQLRLLIDQLNVRIHDEATDEDMAIEGLAGTFVLDPARKTTVDLAGTTRAGDTRGEVRVEASISNLRRRDGGINTNGADAAVTATLRSVPVTLADALAGLNGRLVAVTGPMLDDATLRFNGSIRNGSGGIALDTPHARVRGDVILADGVLTVAEDQPFVARADLRDQALDAWLTQDALDALGLEQRPTLDDETETPYLEARITRASIPIPPNGPISLKGAALRLEVESGNAKLRFDGIDGLESIELAQLQVSVESDDLTETLSLQCAADGRVNETEPSGLIVSIDGRNLLQPDGAFTFNPAALTGEVRGQALATTLLQPFVEKTPVVLARDLGPTVDLVATFSEGDTKTVVVSAAARNFNAEINADVSPDGAVAGRRFTVETDLHPDLIGGLAPQANLRVPRHVKVDLSRFSIPAPPEGAGVNVRSLAAAGSVALSGEPVQTTAAAGAQPIDIAEARINFASPSLAEKVQLDGLVRAQDARIEINQSVTDLFDSAGRFNALGMTPVGTIAIHDVTAQHVEQFAPDFAEIAREGLRGMLTMTIETSGTSDDLRGTVRLQSPGLNGVIVVARSPEEIRIASGRLAAALTPALLRELQKESESPVLVTSDQAAFEIEPTVLATRVETGYIFANPRLSGLLTIASATIENGPVVAQPYIVQNVSANVTGDFGETVSYQVAGTTALHEPESLTRFADLGYGLASGPVEQTNSATVKGRLDFDNIDVPTLERVWQKKPGALADWVGPGGNLLLESTMSEGRMLAHIDAEFPYLNGEFDVERTESRIAVSAKEPTVVMREAALETLLNPVTEGGADRPAARVDVAADVPLSITLKSIVLPAGILNAQPLAPGTTDISVEIAAAEPITMTRTVEGSARHSESPVETEAVTVTLRNFRATLASRDLNKGVILTADGIVETAGDVSSEDQSQLTIASNVRNILNEESQLSLASAAIDLTVDITAFPTWVLDAFAGRDSFLQDALGDAVTAHIESRAFSTESGRLNAQIDSANGSHLIAALVGRRGRIQTAKDQPIAGALALNEALRDRILYKIHPIFADIRSLDEKITFEVGAARFTPDSDISSLDADIHIEVGEIELDPGSQLLSVLRFADSGAGGTIPGFIAPLDIRIRKGVVSYENFIVRIDRKDNAWRHELVFAGKINLPRNHVDEVVGAYPVSAAKTVFEELKYLPDTASFGVKFSGDLYDKRGRPKPLKVEPIFNVKPEDLFRKGVEKGLEELLPDLFGDDKTKGGKGGGGGT